MAQKRLGRLKQKWMSGVCTLLLSWGANGTPVTAQSFTIPSGTTETAPQTLSDGETGVIESGGTLATTGGADAVTGGDNTTVTNRGSIAASGAFANGIVVDDGNTVENAGSIDVSGGFNIGIDALDNNIILNSGEITATDLAFGIAADSNNTLEVSGSVSTFADTSPAIILNDNNTVTITGSLFTQGGGSPALFPDSGNTINLSGNIETLGDMSYGIFTNSDNTIDVSGTITTSGNDADGIFGGNSNTVTVSGHITTSGIDGDGIEVNDFNRITNSGTIITYGAGSADAIEVDDDNVVINIGTLIANGDALANGIDGESNNRIFNQGTIISALGAGMDFTSGSSGSFVYNQGLVRGNGVSIDFGPGDDQLRVGNGSVLDGLVNFDSGSSSIYVQTGNHTITSTGTTPTINSNDDIFFVQNGDTITSLDQDLLGISEMNYAFMDQTHQIHRIVSHQSEGDGTLWVRLYGGFTERNDDGEIPDSDHRFWGSVAGAHVLDVGEGSLGVFGGYGSSRIDSNLDRTNAETDRFFGGAYGTASVGKWAVTANAFGGIAQTDSVRNIANNTSPGGLDAARATFDSLFVGAGIETARLFDEALGPIWSKAVWRPALCG